mgnify:CR=1 FL=1
MGKFDKTDSPLSLIPKKGDRVVDGQGNVGTVLSNDSGGFLVMGFAPKPYKPTPEQAEEDRKGRERDEREYQAREANKAKFRAKAAGKPNCYSCEHVCIESEYDPGEFDGPWWCEHDSLKMPTIPFYDQDEPCLYRPDWCPLLPNPIKVPATDMGYESEEEMEMWGDYDE